MLNAQRIFDPRDPVLVASVSTLNDARNIAAARERTDEDSHSFREMRAMMSGNRHCRL